MRDDRIVDRCGVHLYLPYMQISGLVQWIWMAISWGVFSVIGSYVRGAKLWTMDIASEWTRLRSSN
jgi:hypothetical protein